MTDYYRYMGLAELDKYLSGETLISTTVHARNGSRTTSVGFCFLRDNIPAVRKDGSVACYTPMDAWRFLRGVVRADVLVHFRCGAELTPSIGVYADPDAYDSLSACLAAAAAGRVMEDLHMIYAEEYCCKSYSAEMMYMIEACAIGYDGPTGARIPIWKIKKKWRGK